jgi:hypothetical protein
MGKLTHCWGNKEVVTGLPSEVKTIGIKAEGF